METITHLQEIIERGRQAAEERKRQEELDAIARQEEEAARYRNRLHKSELPEWMIEYLGVELYGGEAYYTLALPGCAPVVFTVITYIDGTHCYDKIGVRTPTELHYDQDADLWIVRYSYDHMPRRADNLDEAIALAAEYGESWHAMKAEAERRNAEGLRPDEKAPTINDLIAEALESRIYGADHRATGVIDALIVIAAELRGIRYTLAKLLKEEAR